MLDVSKDSSESGNEVIIHLNSGCRHTLVDSPLEATHVAIYRNNDHVTSWATVTICYKKYQ